MSTRTPRSSSTGTMETNAWSTALPQDLDRRHELVPRRPGRIERDRRAKREGHVESRENAEPRVDLSAEVSGPPADLAVVEIGCESAGEQGRAEPGRVEAG